MFTKWINFLSYELEALTKATTTKCATRGAAAFKHFPNTRMVLDCTEVFTEQPSGLEARKQLFSNYKPHSTIKFLVGTSPNGSVTYVSKVWAGRSSDKKITCDASGCLDLLQPSEAAMTERISDRGGGECTRLQTAHTCLSHCQSSAVDSSRGDADQAHCSCAYSRGKSNPANQALQNFEVVSTVIAARQ